MLKGGTLREVMDELGHVSEKSLSSTTSVSSPSIAARSSINLPKTLSKQLSYMKSMNEAIVILFRILLVSKIH